MSLAAANCSDLQSWQPVLAPSASVATLAPPQMFIQTHPCRLICGRATFAMLLMMFAPAAAVADEVVVRISYTEVRDRILPFPQKTATNAQLEVRITGTGTVQHTESRVSSGTLVGKAAALKLGTAVNQGWQIAGPSQLINVAGFQSYERAILVTVSGLSCTARVAYNLKPGYADYRYRSVKTGENAVARSVSAVNTTCSIH